MDILNFKFTHMKRSTQNLVGVVDCYLVGVVDRSEDKVFFAMSSDSTVFSLSEKDFRKRYFKI